MPFEPTYNGIPIFRCQTPKSKFRFSASFIGLSYEMLEAARWRGYRNDEFQELEIEEQALIIAHYRIDSQIRAIIEHENEKASRRK